MVLALVVREFVFEDAYAEFDRVNGRGGPREVRGDRAYQVLLGSTKPNCGYPCRVSVAERMEGRREEDEDRKGGVAQVREVGEQKSEL